MWHPVVRMTERIAPGLRETLFCVFMRKRQLVYTRGRACFVKFWGREPLDKYTDNPQQILISTLHVIPKVCPGLHHMVGRNTTKKKYIYMIFNVLHKHIINM